MNFIWKVKNRCYIPSRLLLTSAATLGKKEPKYPEKDLPRQKKRSLGSKAASAYYGSSDPSRKEGRENSLHGTGVQFHLIKKFLHLYLHIVIETFMPPKEPKANNRTNLTIRLAPPSSKSIEAYLAKFTKLGLIELHLWQSNLYSGRGGTITRRWPRPAHYGEHKSLLKFQTFGLSGISMSLVSMELNKQSKRSSPPDDSLEFDRTCIIYLALTLMHQGSGLASDQLAGNFIQHSDEIWLELNHRIIGEPYYPAPLNLVSRFIEAWNKSSNRYPRVGVYRSFAPGQDPVRTEKNSQVCLFALNEIQDRALMIDNRH
ncbi:hypothetical protein BDP27DRAFT_1364146 [Rhodocollybia butyracea]|uniref:Uncharacterized protein n=1 Tax=Rhodocollybia butyracea TaxID=206335 RepID=A0A9P5PS58_9AGAR|nr:hypothetical protein BDP27DRAFT_1364146 [Rhodocollybia butyracea]